MRISDTILRRPLPVAFGQAMQAGGLSSVDLAATRDANSVTITASDGSVAPIGGADGTSAGVMTAADKALLDAVAAAQFESRADLAAASVPAPVQAVRTAGYAAPGDGGGALYRRVGAEPSHNLKVQSADGAWWELVAEYGQINVKQAGAVGDGVTNDGQAFVDALSFATLNAGNDPSTFKVIVPPSEDPYYLGATTLELKRRVVIEGHESGLPSGSASILKWDAQVTGIIVHRYNTIGATTEATPSGGADGSIIRGLRLESAGGTIAGITDDTRGHGIWLRARAVIEDVVISGFPGNGIHILASAGGSPDVEGNANNWTVNRARITGCHLSGIHVGGADTNSGLCLSADCSLNGRWGIYDTSFLGNTYIGCHTANNGVATVGENGGTKTSIIHYWGPETNSENRRFAANASATEAQYVATTPGTDENVWIDLGFGVSSADIPTWQPNQPEGTYFAGGSYRTDDPNARNLLLGCYQESGQGIAQLVKPTIVIGGFVGEGFHGTAAGLGINFFHGDLKFRNETSPTGGTEGVELRLNWAPNKLIAGVVPGDGVGLNLLAWDPNNGHYRIGQHSNLDARRTMGVTSDLNTQSYGRSQPLPGGELVIYKGCWIGSEQYGRRFEGFAPKPFQGEYARGDVTWNNNPVTYGEPAGWRCITPGVVGSGAVFEEYFYVPELPADRGQVLRPHASANRIEWRAAPKAGTATIADAASSVAVTFATAFPDANYAVSVTPDGDEHIWVTAKASTGFTLNRAGTAGARNIDWTATPHEDL